MHYKPKLTIEKHPKKFVEIAQLTEKRGMLKFLQNFKILIVWSTDFIQKYELEDIHS